MTSKSIELSEQQKKAYQMILSFLAAPGGGVFILKGYAGTGKTTLLQELGLYLQRNKELFVMLAPTGRAATVLRSKTGLPTSTIHGQLYHFSDIDGEAPESNKDPKAEEYGQMRLMFSMKIPSADSKKLYIVDEASMISDHAGDPTSYAHFGSGHLLSDLLYAAGTNKVLFAGDPSQLPPVGSLESPALSELWMQKHGKQVISFEMTEILRHKEGSGILRLATTVREQTKLKSYPKYVKLKARDIPQVNLHSHLALMLLYTTKIKAEGFANTIAICRSNRDCLEVNRATRKVLFGHPEAPLQVGDLIMVTQNNYLVPLTNGDFAEITNIGIEQEHLGIKFLRVTVKALITSLEHEILMCTEILHNGQPNLLADQQRTLMIDFSMRMRKKGISSKSDVFFIALQKDPYLNSLRANFGYAVTCYKSQGGEWDNVYLFLNKGMYIMVPQALTRWWYTGITRAKEQLLMVDDWWIY